MIKKENKKLNSILYSCFPFLLFIIKTIFFNKSDDNQIFMTENVILAYFFISMNIILVLKKKYEEEWFFIWFGFFVYFSICFIFNNNGMYSLINFLTENIFKYTKETIYYISNDFELEILLPNIFCIVHIFVFFFLLHIKKLNVTNEKIFNLIFIYYYVYCYFSFNQVNQIFRIEDRGTYLEIMKYNILINSLIASFFYFVIYLKNKMKNIIFLFFVFLFFNFLSFIIFSTHFNRSLNVFDHLLIYLSCFIFYPKLHCYLLFLGFIKFLYKVKTKIQ